MLLSTLLKSYFISIIVIASFTLQCYQEQTQYEISEDITIVHKAMQLLCLDKEETIQEATSEKTRAITTPHSFMLISIMKAGTHLAGPALQKLTQKTNAIQRLHESNIVKDKGSLEEAMQLFMPCAKIFDICTTLKQNEFISGHLVYNQIYENILKQKNMRCILIIRDPRAQIISHAFYMYHNSGRYPGAQHLTFNDLVSSLIGNPDHRPSIKDLISKQQYYYNNQPHTISHIKALYEAYLPWMNSKLCYTVKFENLVGPQGGGSREAQLRELRNIANHLGYNKSTKELETIAHAIFGGTVTFREGKINSWKKYLTHQHKTAIKALAGDMLINLKYEKNYNW